MRRIAGGAVLAGAFLALVAVFVVRLFPADAAARALLARLPPQWPTVVFAHARLGLAGLELDDVTLRAPDGRAVFAADRLAVRPSLAGLRSRAGLPWHVTGRACGGEADAVVNGARVPETVTLGWRDVALATCQPLAVTGGALEGRAALVARLAVLPAVAGDGTVDVYGATWKTTAGPLAALGALHAEHAFVRWTLADDRLRLTALELHGPEVTGNGGGEVRLAAPLDASALDVRVTIAPAANAPALVTAMLSFLPGPPDRAARVVRVGGTVAAPLVVAGP